MLNIVFMGTPDFAKESLKCLVEANHNILAVVTNPDKPQGRGMKMIGSPVKEYAMEKNLRIYQPIKRIKSRCYLCCSLWKNTTTRIARYSKIRLYKCSWFIASKI